MKIDDDVSIMPYNMIVVHKNGKIVLESGCEIGMFSRVAAKNLVQIGKNVVIVGNVTIGKHCIIGANSVVNSNIPDYCVAVGNSAKVVKKYNFDKEEWEKTS